MKGNALDIHSPMPYLHCDLESIARPCPACPASSCRPLDGHCSSCFSIHHRDLSPMYASEGRVHSRQYSSTNTRLLGHSATQGQDPHHSKAYQRPSHFCRRARRPTPEFIRLTQKLQFSRKSFVGQWRGRPEVEEQAVRGGWVVKKADLTKPHSVLPHPCDAPASESGRSTFPASNVMGYPGV